MEKVNKIVVFKVFNRIVSSIINIYLILGEYIYIISIIIYVNIYMNSVGGCGK